MYEIDLNLPKQIVADVLSDHEIHSVAFVGCGASSAANPPQNPTPPPKHAANNKHHPT